MATVLMQARMGSTRLPGKSLHPILGRPMLYYAVETLKKSPVVDRIVLAIPNLSKDDPLVDFAKEQAIECFRGSEDNVLERFYKAALEFRDDFYFRATGDNPVLDYGNPQRLLQHLQKGDFDYTAERRMPIGSVVEAFTFKALERCYKEAHTDRHREHVTILMKESSGYNKGYIQAPQAYDYPKLRLTVDYPEDFQRAREIIENLYADGIPPFKKIMDFAAQKEWL
ncbi:MAG: acylneuraminate cytidylyltransferase [bacterium]|nr:acylneuraminate cytidylyltransferase [bacterium]